MNNSRRIEAGNLACRGRGVVAGSPDYILCHPHPQLLKQGAFAKAPLKDWVAYEELKLLRLEDGAQGQGQTASLHQRALLVRTTLPRAAHEVSSPRRLHQDTTRPTR